MSEVKQKDQDATTKGLLGQHNHSNADWKSCLYHVGSVKQTDKLVQNESQVKEGQESVNCEGQGGDNLILVGDSQVIPMMLEEPVKSLQCFING